MIDISETDADASQRQTRPDATTNPFSNGPRHVENETRREAPKKIRRIRFRRLESRSDCRKLTYNADKQAPVITSKLSIDIKIRPSDSKAYSASKNGIRTKAVPLNQVSETKHPVSVLFSHRIEHLRTHHHVDLKARAWPIVTHTGGVDP